MQPQLEHLEVDALRAMIKQSPVAYFCAEFAVDANLPIYAGGLGILAGDVLAQASEDGRSFVGVGLLYNDGYLRQEISKEANVFSEDPVDLMKAGLTLLCDKAVPVSVTVPIEDREVLLHVYVKMVGLTPLLLLSSNVDTNAPRDQKITDRLYAGDREHRLLQEMILGIGGYRMLSKVGIEPAVYHLNEGHSALFLFELAHHVCECTKDRSYEETLTHLENVVFTNHTLVPAGHDVFSMDMVVSYLQSYAMQIPIDPHKLVEFGLIQDSSLFSPTMLALRLATISQGVSKLHTAKALEVWPDHPLVSVTNGVTQSYWQCTDIRDALGQDDASLWRAHLAAKERLCTLVKDVTGTEWNAQSDCVVTWSRRFARYKRPLTLFEDMERLHSLIEHSPIPLRILIAGKPHASDEIAQQDLKVVLDAVGKSNGSIVYLQNYNIGIAPTIHAGSDVLLNTPVRGLEACGTSGMKASMNGVLQCTTLDGWTDEVNWSEMGWVLDTDHPSSDAYAFLAQEILPLFAKRGWDGIPTEWVARMRKTIAMATTDFSTKRMLHELDTLVYSKLIKETSVAKSTV